MTLQAARSAAVKGVLFDVGGVLVALDGMPALAAMLGVGATHEELHRLWMAAPSVRDHESGRISARTFAEAVVRDLQLGASPDEFLEVFMAWPTHVHPGAVELVAEIPADYQVAILSNTNAAHWERITAMGLPQRFSQCYLSHEIGHLKPTNEAYLAALQGMDLQPEEVVFVDDGPGNVAAAQALGMNAHLVRNPQEARVVLERYRIV